MDAEEIVPSDINTWANFDCLVVQNSLICKKIGPLVDDSTKVIVYVPLAARK